MSDFYTTPLTPELMCSNFENSLRFYQDILGFNIQYARIDEGFAMLEREGTRLMLDELLPGNQSAWMTAPIEAPFGRGVNFQIQTKNVLDLYDRVLKSSIEIFLPLEEKWYRRDDTFLGNKQFIVLDPDGYMLRFFQDLGTRASAGP